jgi:putative SOS response-associated peptidase YedK
MCGRYTYTQIPAEAVVVPPEEAPEMTLEPVYNVAPSHYCPVRPMDAPSQLHLFHWGLIPHWAKDHKIGYRMINARSETILEKPAFRDPVRRSRCLVYADGFYEWQKRGKAKQPFRIIVNEGQPFYFAGISARWRHPDGHWIHSFSILTTEPNELMADIHDRMPVILPPSAQDRWINPHEAAEDLLDLLRPYDPAQMRAYPVSQAVGNVRNQGPELVEPVGEG